MSGQQQEDVARKLADMLATLPEAQLAYLFGSRASGRVRAESDIDVAVLVTEAASAEARAELARLLARLGRVVRSDRRPSLSTWQVSILARRART